MKKKKTGAGEEPHFKNHPFHSLKKFKAAEPSRLHSGTQKKTVPEKPDDAGELFMRAMSGVRKIGDGCGDRHDPGKKERGPAAAPSTADEQRIFLQAMQKIGSVFRKADPESELPARKSSSGRMKQLRRGTIRIREELDLHGLFKDEALVRLERFIEGAYDRGEKAVLVITGKGINSPEGPVLRGAVSEWLCGKGRRVVAEFAPAPGDRGGSGAFVVFLRSRA